MVNIYEMGRILSGACNLMLTVIGAAWPHYRVALCILMRRHVVWCDFFLTIIFIFCFF